MPRFSVVIPTYNRCDRLPTAIDSVLAQTYPDFEVVVVDDGSTEPVEATVTRYTDERVRYVRQPNGGGNVARNTGAAASTGTFIAFLDDDDEAMPTWLERMAALADGDPDCAVLSCGGLYVDLVRDQTKVLVPEDRWSDHGGQVARFDTGMFLVRRDAFEAAGRYVPGLPSGVHNELALRLLPLCDERGWTVRSVPDPLIRVNQRRAETRNRNHPRNRYDGVTYVLDHHEAWLRTHPKKRARLLKAAGTSAARLEDYPTARKLLARAVRATPRDPMAWARLAVACVPPLGNRVWRVAAYREAEQAGDGATRDPVAGS